MYLNQRILLLLALILPSAFLSAQNMGSAPRPFYEIISDPAEVAEIRRKCLMEIEGEPKSSILMGDTISVEALKVLLHHGSSFKNQQGLSKIYARKVKNLSASDAEVIQLVTKFSLRNDRRQVAAFEALTVADPENAARKIIAVIEGDSLRSDHRLKAKGLLGETIISQTTIDYLIGQLSQEMRSIFEQGDDHKELGALLELYKKGSRKQREKIFDFAITYSQKHNEHWIVNSELRSIWIENPEPKHLEIMENYFLEQFEEEEYYEKELLACILRLKGKRGKQLVEKLIVGHNYPYEVLEWAHTNRKLKLQEKVLKALAADMYRWESVDMKNLWVVGGQAMIDQYLSYTEGSRRIQSSLEFVKLRLAPIGNAHPMRRLADTLYKAGFIASPLSTPQLESLRAREEHERDGKCICSLIKTMPCFYRTMRNSRWKFREYLAEVLIPVTDGALNGLEYYVYNWGENQLEYFFFKGKAYRFLNENYRGSSSNAYQVREDAHSRFLSMNFLLELHGIQERFYEIPESNKDEYEGGFYTTPERARVIFSFIGRAPWKH